LAGEIHPAGHEFAFAWRGKVLGQFGHDACAEQELKELGLGDIGSQLDVIEAAGAKLIDDQGFFFLQTRPGSWINSLKNGMRWRTAFMEFGFAQLDTSGLQGIDDVEQLPLPADELGARLSATAIVIGHVA
jgi:hypothetical protein